MSERGTITYEDIQEVIDTLKNNEIPQDEYIYCLYGKKQYKIRFNPYNPQWYVKTIFGYIKCKAPI